VEDGCSGGVGGGGGGELVMLVQRMISEFGFVEGHLVLVAERICSNDC